MKKINLLLVIGVLITACSKSDGDENKAPSIVKSLLYPTNNLLCTDSTIEFEWASSLDPDGDGISYLLEISQNISFSSIDQSFTVNTNSKSVTLEKGVLYYWRVKAIDIQGLGSDYSQIYQFYTEGEGITNHLPFSPEVVAPDLNTIVSEASISLQWSCSDLDNDPLSYDVYFDTVNPPAIKVEENQSANSLNVSLNASTTYFWQIIAKDDKGGASIGQIWSFTTN